MFLSTFGENLDLKGSAWDPGPPLLADGRILASGLYRVKRSSSTNPLLKFNRVKDDTDRDYKHKS